jgi:hypothetical protein
MQEQCIFLTSGALVKKSTADGLGLPEGARAPGVQLMSWLAIRSLAKWIRVAEFVRPCALELIGAES